MDCIRAIVVIPLVCALAATGCTSFHRTALVGTVGQPVAADVNAGDKVRVTLRDGRRAEFRVKSADHNAIIATDGTVYVFGDIGTVERRQFSWVKTAVLGSAVAAGVALVAIAMAYRPTAGWRVASHANKIGAGARHGWY